MGKKANYLDRFFKRQRAPKEDATPPPEKGATLFYFLVTTHTSKLFLLNLLFILFSLPVITLPAALSGMNRVCMLLVREGVCYVWSDFIKEFKASFFKSIPAFLLTAAFIAAAFYCFASSQNKEVASFLLLIITVLLFVFGLLIGCYAFAMLSICNLRTRDMLRNALYLIFLEPKADLLLGFLVGGIIIAFTGFLPFSIPFALVLFSFLTLISCTIVHEPIKKRIIKVD